MKKLSLMLCALLLSSFSLFSQSLVYDDFEGKKWLSYTTCTGILDTLSANPSSDSINNSKSCAKYVRNVLKKFDVIKMHVNKNLTDVTTYSTYLGIPPKLKMKVYTSAPVGTLVEILLGNQAGNNAYPAGTNSQYQARTTVMNSWEVLEFKFAQIPNGSETSATQIDQITLLFNPNTSTSDIYYFDEISGPSMISENSELGDVPVNTSKVKKVK